MKNNQNFSVIKSGVQDLISIFVHRFSPYCSIRGSQLNEQKEENPAYVSNCADQIPGPIFVLWIFDKMVFAITKGKAVRYR